MRPVSVSAAGGMIGLVLIVSAVTSRAAWAQDQAYCNLSSVDRVCLESDFDASATGDASSTNWGARTRYLERCLCASTCNIFVSKKAGNLAHVEIQLVCAEFGGTYTEFTHRVCDRPDSAHDLPDSREARASTAWAGLGMLEMEL